MKKLLYFSLLLGAIVSFSSCTNEEDDLFNSSAAERLNQMKEEYSEALWRSPNGWAMQYYPTYENEDPYGRGYLLLCDFNEDYSVRVAMNYRNVDGRGNVSYSYDEDTSAWEILTDNGPVLSFNSYNRVMHTFSDPEDIQSTETSETGRGYEGDYEFIIVNAPTDASYMILKGKKRGTYSLLTPMSEAVDFKEYLDDVIRFQDKMFSKDAPTYNVVSFGENTYKMEDANDGIPNIYPFSGDRVLDESFNPFLITKRGEDYYLRFRDAFNLPGDITVQDFRYDTSLDRFVSVDNSEYFITGDVPARFFNETMNRTSALSWNFNLRSNMSDDVKTIVTAINQEMRSLKQTLKEFSFVNDGGNLALRIAYNNTQCYYYFNRAIEGDNMTLTLVGPKDEPAQNLINNVAPSIQSLLEIFNGKTFVVSATNTRFDLTKVTMTQGETFIDFNFVGSSADVSDEA